MLGRSSKLFIMNQHQITPCSLYQTTPLEHRLKQIVYKVSIIISPPNQAHSPLGPGPGFPHHHTKPTRGVFSLFSMHILQIQNITDIHRHGARGITDIILSSKQTKQRRQKNRTQETRLSNFSRWLGVLLLPLLLCCNRAVVFCKCLQ